MKRSLLLTIQLCIFTLCTSQSIKVIDNDTVAIFNRQELKAINKICTEYDQLTKKVLTLTDLNHLLTEQIAEKNALLISKTKQLSICNEQNGNIKESVQLEKEQYEILIRKLKRQKRNTVLGSGVFGLLLLFVVL